MADTVRRLYVALLLAELNDDHHGVEELLADVGPAEMGKLARLLLETAGSLLCCHSEDHIEKARRSLSRSALELAAAPAD